MVPNATPIPNGNTYTPSNESDKDGGSTTSDRGSTGPSMHENADAEENIGGVLHELNAEACSGS